MHHFRIPRGVLNHSLTIFRGSYEKLHFLVLPSFIITTFFSSLFTSSAEVVSLVTSTAPLMCLALLIHTVRLAIIFHPLLQDTVL